jgi:GT2 family glycosyltransferase
METKEKPFVSIITVNYNGVKVTLELLESLSKVSYPYFEIIVVDNASLESPDILKEKFPIITLIKSPVNTGFAGGNNVGFRAAKGKYFLLLNNDTEVDPGFLEPLVQKLEEDPQAGAVSSKVIFHNSENIIQYAGGGLINPFTGRGGFIGTHEKDESQYPTSITAHAHGAAMMVKREVVEKIGMMAELYFLYYEELDFCERIKKAHYSIWYIAESRVYHKESMTVGKENSLKVYYLTRNRILFLRRNSSKASLYVFLLYFILIALPKNVFVYLLRKRIDLLKSFIKGLIWNFGNKPVNENPSLN